MSLLLNVILLVYLGTLTGVIYRRYLHPLSKYNGPFLASFTNLWRFSTYFTGKHHLIDQELHTKYGPIVRTGPNSLSFSSLSAFDTIYGFNGHFEKGIFYSFGRADNNTKNSIFTAHSDASHREHRKKVVGPALSTSKIATYSPVIEKQTSVLLSRLEEERSQAKDTATVDISSLVHNFTFNTMLEIIYGSALSGEPYTNLKAAEGIVPAFKGMSKFAIGTAMLPWFQWLMSSSPAQARIRKPKYDMEGNPIGVAALVLKTRNLVITHPEEVLKSDHASILKNYLQVPESDSRHMEPEQIWRECFNLVFAGPGSTAAALTAVIYELATHHEWADRIRAEYKEGQLKNLTAVIKETLRLRAPFPTAFPRDITPGAETAIAGLTGPLPVGTVVSANTYVLGHSKEIWGADAEEWRPERWLKDDMAEKKRMEEGFVVFGKGARGCIGKEIALMVLERAVTSVLQMWDLSARGELRGDSFLEMQYRQCLIAFVNRK